MARRKISSGNKTNRKDDLDPSKDQFIDKTMSLFDWAYERRRPIILFLIAALLVSIGGIIAGRFFDSQKEDASGALAKGLETATAPIIPPSEDEGQIPTKAESEVLTFETFKARSTASAKEFEQIIGRGEASTINFAKLGKAAAKYDLGEYDEAAEIYQTLISTKEAKIPWVRRSAIEGLGLALEAAGKTEAAAKQFETLMNDKDTKVANTARYHSGRIAAKKGDNEKAIKLFSQVMESYSEGSNVTRFDYLFVQTRQYLLALNPEAEVPEVPASGLEGVDPQLLRQLMQARAGGGQS